jgi:hypothetical protein
MPTEQWLSAANAAISAIRAAGATNLILVPGNSWSGAHSWTQSWYGTPNSTAMLNISDPGNNYAFEVHQYLDSDSSGTSSSCVSGTIGSQRMQSFTNWLRANGKRGFLGEFGGGSGQTCLSAIDNILDHLEANTDVYLGWTYWAAGPWWGGYFTSLEPNGGNDKPQMDALEPHLGSLTPPPPPPPPPPSGCQSATYEAESMFHSTGGSVSGGWNIWSNGYISTNHAFSGGSVTIRVRARGQSAAGVWPRMTLSVGGAVVGTTTVNSTSFAEYAFTVNANAGTREIRVSFDNDYFANGEDRNLYVDRVVVACPVTCQSATYEAESIFHSTGGSTSGGWNIWSNGYIATNHGFSAGSTQLTVTAQGTVAAGVWPRMTVTVGGVNMGTTDVNSTSWTPYTFTFNATAGTREIRVIFDNDYFAGGQDRNLLVDKLAVGCL